MYSIPPETYEYVEDEFLILANEFFNKPFSSDSLSELRFKVSVLGMETGLTDFGRCIQVLVEPVTKKAYLFVEAKDEHI